ncbi:MAG TPA: hypothetical protein DCE41_01925 [Cytophagales bacterium]|nr:hypothetical protein [Cytophagales bacterium]HAA19638.1 hypothetical protein [Cytophagales bacterium]HAP58988.1 hypothetical protein [Cytophagales bacterium]
MGKREELNSFLTEEYKNSVAHIRHHEILRSRHLAFFFTILLASIGFFINQLKGFDMANMTHELFSTSLALVLVLSLFASLMLIIIKKQGFAMALHESTIHWIREYSLSRFNLSYDTISGKYSSGNPIRSSRVFSIQRVFEAILIGSSVLLDLVFLLIYLNAIEEPYFNFNINFPLILFFAFIVVFQIYLFFKDLYYSKSPYRQPAEKVEPTDEAGRVKTTE